MADTNQPISTPPPPPLGHLLLRTAWIGQALTALPPAFFLGAFAFNEVLYPYNTVYDFLTFSLTACMAAGIIFIVEVQRRVDRGSGSVSARQTLLFEVVKAVLATAMWIWLLADSVFKERGYYDSGGRRARIERAGIASVLIFVLYYPTAIYAWSVWRQERKAEREEIVRHYEDEGVHDERTPLVGMRG